MISVEISTTRHEETEPDNGEQNDAPDVNIVILYKAHKSESRFVWFLGRTK